MDFITPGIRPQSAQSARVLRAINSNNVISLSIKSKFKQVNKLTGSFLTTDLASYSELAQKASTQPGVRNSDQLSQFTVLSDTFQQLYYLLGVDEFKFDNVSQVDLTRLQRLYSKVEGLEQPVPGSPEKLDLDQSSLAHISTTTNELINYYLLLTVNLNVANTLIYQTLVLKSHLVYWEDLYNSRTNKLVYLVQTLPIKTYDLGKSILEHARQRINNSDSEYEFSTSSVSRNVEEDNWIYNNLVRFKHFFRIVYATGRSVIRGILVQNNPTISLLNISSKTTSFSWYKQIIKSTVKSPMNTVNREIKAKIDQINSQIEAHTTKINHMVGMSFSDKAQTIKQLETVVGIESKSLVENQRISVLLSKAIDISKQTTTSTEQPSFLTRYWLLIVLALVYGPSQTVNAYQNRQEIADWFKHNFVDTVVGFFKNWLIKPINDMLNILRHDDELSITSKESLKSDLDSLERMVVDFVSDEKITNIDKQQIHNSIQNGDLTLLMSQYESQIRSPVKSIIKGSLIRSILIQIQKTKVDGGLAINGIDKLLKSQQLVFGIVSISPSLFIVYKLWGYFWGAKPISINGKQVNVLCLKGLNSIENLLINLNANPDKPSNYEGKLLIEIVNLIIIAQLIIPKQLKKDWIRDLNELNNKEYNVETKLELIRKVWNMYGPYFR